MRGEDAFWRASRSETCGVQ